MNTLYQDLYFKAKLKCETDSNFSAWQWEERYAEAIVQECLNQMSDHLDKQRVIKHFGIKEK